MEETVDLYGFLRDPSTLDKDSVERLRAVVEKCPYFQGACMLYLKNLHVLGEHGFEAELKRLAVRMPDLRKLFVWLEGEDWALVERKSEDKGPAFDSFSLIDNFLSVHEEKTDRLSGRDELIQPTVSSDYLFWSRAKDEEKSANESTGRLKHQDLIDSFIENERKGLVGPIRLGGKLPDEPQAPALSEETEEDSPKSLDDSYFTETLARIYIKQKRYEKALQIIKNLSLKYPEKNIYFADQIRFLEKLIINTKKSE